MLRQNGSVKNLLGKLVFNLRLNRAAKRSCTVNGIEARIGNQINDLGRKAHFNLHVFEPFSRFIKHTRGDLMNFVFGKLVEHYDFVNTVEKLRPERLFKLAHDRVMDSGIVKRAVVLACILKAYLLALACNELCADI